MFAPAIHTVGAGTSKFGKALIFKADSDTVRLRFAALYLGLKDVATQGDSINSTIQIAGFATFQGFRSGVVANRVFCEIWDRHFLLPKVVFAGQVYG